MATTAIVRAQVNPGQQRQQLLLQQQLLQQQQLQQQRQQFLQQPQQAGPGGDDATSREAAEGVFIPESSSAQERLELAKRKERLKEWNQAADLFQEILTDPKYAAKVVPADNDPEHRLYRSVEDLVMQHLAKWPPEGLEVYRARYEAQAQAQVEGAKGNSQYALHQVFSRFFVTDVAKNAGIKLMDQYLEDGEFRAAADIGDRLLQWHPNVGADRAGILYRTALAYHLGGEEKNAQARLDDLKKNDAQAKGTVRGAEVVLADSLASELALPAPTASGGGAADSYTMFGGDGTRNKVPMVTGTPGAHLYSVALSKPVYPNGSQGPRAEAQYKEDVKSGMTTGVMPVIDRGELFFQDGQRIYAVNLESGVPLSGWIQSNGAEHSGAFRFPGGISTPRTRQLTLTVTDHSVLAVVNTIDVTSQGQRFGVMPTMDTRVVCIDRSNGKLQWMVQPSGLKQEALRSLQLSGSPLVVGDNVIVTATESKQAGFEDYYVVCFALDTGAVRWASNIASSSTFAGGFPFGQAAVSAPAESHLAFANGRVYVQTNRGAVAAVDAFSGAISWLNTYSRGATLANNGFNAVAAMQSSGQQSGTKPWTFNPVIVSQGLVFTLPAEGKNLLIYDAASGVKFKQIDLDDLGQRVKSDDIQPPNYDTLVGVVGDELVLAGIKSVVAVNWRTYDAEHYSDEKMLMWEEAYDKEIRGRPFLTQTHLYLPLQERMYIVNLKNGFAERDYPQYPRSWGDDEGPGNIVVTSDHAVIAGAEHVDVYTDLAAAKARLDREVAEAPADPQPRLRYAEVTYAAGDYATALTKLDDAIAKAGGVNMQPGPVRDRIFNDALTFAQKLKTDETPEGRQRVESLFDRAAKAAYVPEQEVYYRTARASFDQIKGDMPAAVELYQQILSDARYRVVSLPDETAKAPRSADVVARDRIDALIRRDPTVYQKFEGEASEALRVAEQTGDPAKLLSVAQTYPNSSVAAKAMLDAATAYGEAGKPRLARRVLLDMFFDRRDKSTERAQIVEALARTDVTTGARLLEQGASDMGDPKLRQALRLPDGSEIAVGTAFSKAAQQIRKLAPAKSHLVLPKFGMPLPPTIVNGKYPQPFKEYGLVIGNVDALPDPLAGYERRDRIVTWSAEGTTLNLYKPGERTPVGSNHQVNEKPVRCAWVVEDLVVWGARQMFVLRDDGKTLVWKADLAKLPALETLAPDDGAEAGAVMNNPMNNAVIINNRNVFIQRRFVRGGAILLQPQVPQAAKPVSTGPEQIDQVVPISDRLIVSTTNGRVACFETADGHLGWQIRLSDRPVDRVLANEDFTVIHSENDSNIRLEVLDTFSGHVRSSKVFTRMSNSYPQNVALSADGVLAYTLPDRICFRDLYASSQRVTETRLGGTPASYLGMRGPDQLLVEGRQVLAMASSGGTVESPGQKFVRIYSLDTGEPVKVQVDKQQVEQQLSAGTKSPEVRMKVAGTRLFTIAPDACNSYDLKKSDEHHSVYGPELLLTATDQKIDVTDAFIGSDFLVFVGYDNDPGNAVPAAQAIAAPGGELHHKSAEVAAFGRYQTPRGEGARLDYPYKVEDKSGITDDWQAFEGGICYRTQDNKLHLLMGGK
jgi:outer membrane protein assembly factor BamB